MPATDTGPEKPSLLIHSNAPWAPTGYGQQTGLFAPRLADQYRVGVSAFYGLEGAPLNWNGLPVYPGRMPDLGADTLGRHARTHHGEARAGLTLSLMDVWALGPQAAAQVNLAAWVPVDHDPAPPRVLSFFRDSGAVPIAMTRWGQKLLAEFDALYVPHGIDTKTYRPIDRAEARRVTQLPQEPFIVGMVAANKGTPSRKCFAEAIMAFKALHDRHPDTALYLHTEATGIYQGVDLPALLRDLAVPGEAVYLCDQDRLLYNPFGHETMAHVYSSLDVLLSPSAGEGFGIPVVEANACGVPAIVTDFSAQPEVLSAGWTVDYQPTWTAQGSWQASPVIADITRALIQSYARGDRGREKMAADAREGALAYDADTVLADYMLPALKTASDRWAERAPRRLKGVTP